MLDQFTDNRSAPRDGRLCRMQSEFFILCDVRTVAKLRAP